MSDTPTGEGTSPTTPPAGDPTPPAPGDGGAAPVAGLQAALDEQRKVQAGLDRRVNQLSEQLRLAEEEKTALLSQLEEARKATTTTTGELETLKSRLPQLEGELGTLREQHKQVEAKAAGAEIVATEFPFLAPLLQVGGLPPYTAPDEYRTKLQSITKALNIGAQAQFQQANEGTKPPAAPPAGGMPDAGDLLAEMTAAADKQDWTRHGELAKQWAALFERP